MPGEYFSLPRCVEMAGLCEVVKLDAVPARKAIRSVGGDVPMFTSTAEGTQMMIAEFATHSAIVFRGTEVSISRPLEAYRDIKTDLMFRKTDFHGLSIHRGFVRAYMGVLDDVRGFAHETKKPIYIAGHSLGGALAKLAAIEIPRAKINAVYTFGAPRIGTSRIDDAIGAPLYQVIHAADLVPRLPLMIMGFRRAGDKRYITRKGRLVRSPSSVRMAGRFIWTLLRSPTRVIKDHDLAKYRHHITRGLQ